MKRETTAGKILECLSNCLYPSGIYCIACGDLINRTRPYSLCDKCAREMNWATDETCEKCGRILSESEIKLGLCADCAEQARLFHRGFTCAAYGPLERTLIYKFKYDGKTYYGGHLAEIMADKLAMEHVSFDIIVPVPLHKKKERKRGFNQTQIIAEALSRLMEVEADSGALVRTRDTEPMRHLGADARRFNVSGAFEIPKKKENVVENKRVLLIDDVFTTGSTIEECTRALLQGGAKEVSFITFASGADISAI